MDSPNERNTMTQYKVNATYTFDIEIMVEADNEEHASITASLQQLGDWTALSQQLDINSVEEIA
jgi:hypothetical protein